MIAFIMMSEDISITVWYKTKFGSQILATNFGVFFVV